MYRKNDNLIVKLKSTPKMGLRSSSGNMNDSQAMKMKNPLKKL